MNEIYLWCVTGMTALVSANTVWRLFSERDRLSREDLTDEDRAFAWRIVIFIVYPLLTFLDLRTTDVAARWFGGYIKDWSYGLVWFHAVPQGLPDPAMLLPVLFAGAVVECALALCLLPALLFRPHPFLSTLIGYTAAFTLGLNLVIDPLLSAAGLGGPRWHLAFTSGDDQQKIVLLTALAVGSLLYVSVMASQRVRLWFSGLSRPQASDELKVALLEMKARPESAAQLCRVGLLYDKAGLRRRARSQLQKLRSGHPHSLYTHFLEAILAYKRRDYRLARQSFLNASEFPAVDSSLRGSLLAAAACSAFAAGDTTAALNLSERALEFDDDCLVARMVKVDVFLRTGKKEQAGEELLLAMRRGLTLDLENKVPLDSERAFESLVRLESTSIKPYAHNLELPARPSRER